MGSRVKAPRKLPLQGRCWATWKVLWGQSWTSSFAVLTSSRETVLACRGAEPLGTDPCSGREHLLGLAWAGCQRPGVKSSDLWVSVKGTQNCQVMEEGGALPCVIRWETVRVQRGQECRGEAGTPRRGPSQGRGSDLSSTVSVPSSSGMFILWGCCNQSPHHTQSNRNALSSSLEARVPRPRGRRGHPPPAAPGEAPSLLPLPASGGSSRSPLGSGCSLQFLPFLHTAFPLCLGPRPPC